MYTSVAITHKGNVRERNEDSLLANPDMGLWVVADGVGGNVFGEFASQLAVKTIEKKIRQGVSLVDAVDAAHWSILDSARKNPDMRGMATTVLACHFQGNSYRIAWVGDSRAYLCSKDSVVQLTKDHNQAGELLSTDDLTEEEADAHPGQHYLTRALGLNGAIEIDTVEGELTVGERLLLCTDGLSSEIPRQDLYKLLLLPVSDEEKMHQMLEACLDAGGSDNITMAIVGVQRSLPDNRLSDDGAMLPPAQNDGQRQWAPILAALGAGALLAAGLAAGLAFWFRF